MRRAAREKKTKASDNPAFVMVDESTGNGGSTVGGMLQATLFAMGLTGVVFVLARMVI